MNDLTLLQKERSERDLGLMVFHKEINEAEAKIAAEDQGLRFFMIMHFAGIEYEKEQRQGARQYN